VKVKVKVKMVERSERLRDAAGWLVVSGGQKADDNKLGG